MSVISSEIAPRFVLDLKASNEIRSLVRDTEYLEDLPTYIAEVGEKCEFLLIDENTLTPLDTLFTYAVKIGYFSLAKQIIRKLKISPFTHQNALGETPYELAKQRNEEYLITEFERSLTDILQEAIDTFDIETLRQHLIHIKDINEAIFKLNIDGLLYQVTLLNYVLNERRTNISREKRCVLAKMLLTEYRASPTIKDSENNDAYLLASFLNEPELMALLNLYAPKFLLQLQNEKRQAKNPGVENPLETKETKTKTENKAISETTVKGHHHYLDEPALLYKIKNIIDSCVKQMLENPHSTSNIFTDAATLPYHFFNAKVKIPSQYTYQIFGEQISQFNFILGYTWGDAHERAMEFGSLFDIYFNEHLSQNFMVIEVTLKNGLHVFLTIQSEHINTEEFRFILNNMPFVEEAFMAVRPADPISEWDELNNYTAQHEGRFAFYANEMVKEVEKFYSRELHPKICADVCKSLELKFTGIFGAPKGNAIVIEIGAGTGNLSLKLYKKLAHKDRILHVIGLDLLKSNTAIARQNAEEEISVIKKGERKSVSEAEFNRKYQNNTLNFYTCNSLTLLKTLEELKVYHEIRETQKKYFLQHDEVLPIHIVSSGALNRVVFNNNFESLRVLQNIYRLQPEAMTISGITECLVNSHILKNAGFQVLYEDKGLASGNYYKIKSKPVEEVAKNLEVALKLKPNELDLTLNSDPLSTIQSINKKLLAETTYIDISFVFFKDIDEMTNFFKFIQTNCPKLQKVKYDYHIKEDAKLYQEARNKIKANLEDPTDPNDPFLLLLSKIAINYIQDERVIAYRKEFTNRLTDLKSYLNPEMVKTLKTPLGVNDAKPQASAQGKFLLIQAEHLKTKTVKVNPYLPQGSYVKFHATPLAVRKDKK